MSIMGNRCVHDEARAEPSPKSDATVRPRVERSSAAECVSAPTTNTCLHAPDFTIAVAECRP